MLRIHRLSFGQIILASVLGVAGGIYIYLPIFRPGPQGQQRPEKERDDGAHGDGTTRA